MAIGPVRQGTVSQDIKDLAGALLSRQRAVVDAYTRQRSVLQGAVTSLNGISSRLAALRSALDALAHPGALSPFAAMRADSSQPEALGAQATPSASPGVSDLVVQQLARRATHASDVYVDGTGLIVSQGVGTFTFMITVAGIDYPVTVELFAGDTDVQVLDRVVSAITTAAGAAVGAQRVQTESGRSRLVVSSLETGTSHRLVFTDTDGLLARLGVVHPTPTAATETTGGYVAEDLGNHELDARLTVNGLGYVRERNTVDDLLPGVTLTLRSATAGPVTVSVGPDTTPGVDAIKAFVRAYNDVVAYVRSQTAVDPSQHTAGPLAQSLPARTALAQLRTRATAAVDSVAAGAPDSLAALGIRANRDGTLTITDEADLRARIAEAPEAVAEVFRAADGVAERLTALADELAGPAGTLTADRVQRSQRMIALDRQIARLNERLAVEQSRLETSLARSQALLQDLIGQQTQIRSILAGLGFGSSLA
ncbi:MAG TPA: flagellar filament capping protein FliD [Candidatus Binatia bacterium]|nr:flagellar filament capping protein FliD [Candidatus Binatia bacterium]